VAKPDDIIGRHPRAHLGRNGFARAKRRKGAGYFVESLAIKRSAIAALERLTKRAGLR
jgi:hypothetical protein